MIKRLLITGKDSYIGSSVEAYLKRMQGQDQIQWEIATLSQLEATWRQESFSGWDVIFHVTGIAHSDTGGADEARKALYYKVNRDLAIETARKAREEGVGLFIFMSSMIVYGGGGRVDAHTPLKPENYYGDSKKQAEEGLLKLASDRFRVAILRPPMIYGPGSKGNYPILAKMAGKLPLFPKVDNPRSVLYVDNLAELVRQLAASGQGGIYHPQNEDYVTTARLVEEIARARGNRIRLCSWLNPFVHVAERVPGKVGRLTAKAFGSFLYDKTLSAGPEGRPYALVNLRESIERTEMGGQEKKESFGGKSSVPKEFVMPDRPLISLITVAYNSETTLATTIESVLAQDYDAIEYLIIDGASKDGTLRVAESYRKAMEEAGIHYGIISEPDHGIYDAMNKGISLARGDIIGIINSDDWYEPCAVSCAASTFRTKGCDLMFADIRMHVRDGRSFIKRGRQRSFQTSRDWNHPTTFVRADLYKANPFACLGIHDDYGFYLQMRRQGARIVTVDRTLANFRMGGASNHKSLRAAIKRIRDRYLYCYRRNGYSRWYMVECVAIEAAKFILG